MATRLAHQAIDVLAGIKAERLHLGGVWLAVRQGGFLDGAIDYYNNVRLHSAISHVTPRDMLESRVVCHPDRARAQTRGRIEGAGGDWQNPGKALY